jgi:5-methyltetrahydropteroyltriglutamate--homocysteine methyltransferase
MRRESYSNNFANALSGLDPDRPGVAVDRTGAEVAVPRVIGPIERVASVEAPHVAHLRSLSDKPLKVTVPGPFTLACQAQDDYYGDPGELAAAYADAVRAEIVELFEAGADIVQLDEPYLQARPERARDHGVAVIDRALDGVAGPGRRTALHVCFGYGAHVADKPTGYSFLAELGRSAVEEISVEAAQPGLDLAVLASLPAKRVEVGVLDLRSHEIEEPEHIAARLREAIEAMGAGGADRLVVAPDCGMKYLPRPVAYAKLAAMCAGALIARSELAP